MREWRHDGRAETALQAVVVRTAENPRRKRGVRRKHRLVADSDVGSERGRLAVPCYDEGGNFAGDGFFNPNTLRPEFAICDATDELYERVYGRPPNVDDDD
jgi:hypothetical protein